MSKDECDSGEQGGDALTPWLTANIVYPVDYAYLDANGGIYVYGQVGGGTLTSVCGRVNSNAPQCHSATGISWSFASLKKAVLGPGNTISICCYAPDPVNPAPRTVYGLKGYTTAEYASALVHRWECAGLGLDEALPRYWRLSIDGAPRDELLGGLLHRSEVYLTYDVAASTDTEAVWRDINLPEQIGKWALRVRREDTNCYLAQLLLSRLQVDRVLPPGVIHMENWSLTRRNVSALPGKAGEEDSLRLSVEPA